VSNNSNLEAKTPCNRTVLLVEDEADIREAMRDALEMESYSVFAAANGQEALDILERICKPCVIILDLMMPVLDGWEFRKKQKEQAMSDTVPVVVVSAAGAERMKTIDAAAYMRKPIELRTLMDTVRKYCQN
jgi:DNA-binding response OmpR family regulator